MRQIVSDWREFCEGKGSFESGHFYTLFMDNPTEEELKIIYSYFPKNEELISRMKKWFSHRKNDKSTLSQSQLENLLKKDISERKDMLNKIQESTNHKLSLDHIIYDFKQFEIVKEELLDDSLSQYFFDYVSDTSQLLDGVKTNLFYELYDALYGITSDFNIRLFLYSPLLKVNYSANYLYDFVINGGFYAITQSNISYAKKS